jgi:hypothetical protein
MTRIRPDEVAMPLDPATAGSGHGWVGLVTYTPMAGGRWPEEARKGQARGSSTARPEEEARQVRARVNEAGLTRQAGPSHVYAQ